MRPGRISLSAVARAGGNRSEGLVLLLCAHQRQEVNKSFGDSLGMRGGAKQQGIFRKLCFEFRDCAGTVAGLQNAGAAALAGDADSVQDEVVLAGVLALVLDRVDVVQIEVCEARIDLVMSVIELDRAEFGPRGNHTVDLGNFRRVSRLSDFCN